MIPIGLYCFSRPIILYFCKYDVRPFIYLSCNQGNIFFGGWELTVHKSLLLFKNKFLFNICSPYCISPNQNGRYFLFVVCLMSTRINFVLIYVKTLGINFIHMMIQKFYY